MPATMRSWSATVVRSIPMAVGVLPSVYLTLAITRVINPARRTNLATAARRRAVVLSPYPPAHNTTGT